MLTALRPSSIRRLLASTPLLCCALACAGSGQTSDSPLAHGGAGMGAASGETAVGGSSGLAEASAAGNGGAALGGSNGASGSFSVGGSSGLAESGGIAGNGGVGGASVGGALSSSGAGGSMGGTAGGTGGVAAVGGTGGMGGTVSSAGASSFHCVNWADPRDNYVHGLLALSGLSSSSDTYETVQSKAGDILSEFQSKLAANAIRIPINEPTVSGAWWKAYKGVIDTAAAKGMKVIVAYWAWQNGKADDPAAFKAMWQTVISAYQSNPLVYFDIHNEPYGYGSSWNDTAAQWLSDFPNVPRGRVIVAGTGYDDNVVPVGSDSRFAGCLLQLHIYGFWHTTWTTQKQWHDSMTSALGTNSARTIVGEWGAPLTTGINYGLDTNSDLSISYVRAVADVMHTAGMGSCYWPGLRNGDSYSMTTLSSGGSPLTLSVNNASGLERVHWAWQL